MRAADVYAPAFGFIPGYNYDKNELTDAYKTLAKTGHPDAGGDAALWTLITAAYGQMCKVFNKARSPYDNKGDGLWLKEYEMLLNGPQKPSGDPKASRPDNPKPEAPSEPTDASGDSADTTPWMFTERDGEEPADRRRRRAREYQQWRIKNDPVFAASRSAASKKSRLKSAAKSPL